MPTTKSQYKLNLNNQKETFLHFDFILQFLSKKQFP